MKFSYVALTGDNKKITGVLESDNMEIAQSELHKMGVAIISVNDITEEEYEKLKQDQKAISIEKGIQTFTFIAEDKNKKEIEGTIDAIDASSAYKRLRTEYQFKVNELYLSSASDEEKKASKGALEGFEEILQAELERTESKKTKNEEDEGSEENKELISDIDNIIINTKELLETQQEIFSNDLIREISSTLGELERVRTSNNIKHITEVGNNLYELISNPDKIEDKTQSPKYKSILNKLQDSALVKKEFDLYKKSGMQTLFQRIAEKIKNVTESKGEEKTTGKSSGMLWKVKNKINKLMGQISQKDTAKKKKRQKKPKSKLSMLASKFMDYMTASSPVLKKVRKKEFVKALKSIISRKEKTADEENVKKAAETAKKSVLETGENQQAVSEEKTEKKWDFTWLFVEIDSFISWLLCFYIIYFFLVNFSFEKNIGLSREFVFKTLKSDLILNITIFLLIFHFALRIRNLHFRKNFLATLFLTFLSLGVYAIIIINF
jgi:hypothetical protein